ncbi:MAG TPA: hypothetical protein VGD23_06940 [Sphingomicrobium sp.]
MWRLIPIGLILLSPACSSRGPSIEPSLAPRAAEAIDPRVPIPDNVPAGALDAGLAERLGALVGTVRGGVPAFEAREAEARRLASAAGPMASESWIAAQQALSRLVEQYGVTTQAAADIDLLASGRLREQRWIEPADRLAIETAAAEVAAISQSQSATIGRITNQLER